MISDETPESLQRLIDYQNLIEFQYQEQVELRKQQGFNRLSPEERYHKDPQFKSLIDMLEMLIERAQLTPTEIREAATLACIHYEQRRCKPFFYEV